MCFISCVKRVTLRSEARVFSNLAKWEENPVLLLCCLEGKPASSDDPLPLLPSTGGHLSLAVPLIPCILCTFLAHSGFWTPHTFLWSCLPPTLLSLPFSQSCLAPLCFPVALVYVSVLALVRHSPLKSNGSVIVWGKEPLLLALSEPYILIVTCWC